VTIDGVPTEAKVGEIALDQLRRSESARALGRRLDDPGIVLRLVRALSDRLPVQRAMEKSMLGHAGVFTSLKKKSSKVQGGEHV
jgi:hypothetical protein